jgi:hypothetical protein
MLTPKSGILIPSLILCFGIIARSQNLNIYLCPLIQDNLVKSMVCVSKADGQSLFEYILTENDIANGSEFNLTLPDPQHYCLTIINEYQIDTVNDGNSFYWAKTYYDQGGDFRLYKFDHPPYKPHYKEIPGSITLRNAPVIEHWQHFTKATISNYKQTETTIRTQTNFWVDEDMFVILKAEKDDRYRYIYMRQDEILTAKNAINPYNALQFDWKTLRTDLQHIILYHPFDTPPKGEISAVNSASGKTCILYRSNSFLQDIIPPGVGLQAAPTLTPPKGIIDLRIPSEPLTDYKANVTWGNWHKEIAYNYRIWHGDEMKFPHYNEAIFLPEYFDMDTLGIRTKINSFMDCFRIFYTKADKGAYPEYGSKMFSSFRSNWIVIGKNRGAIDFKLPIISEASKAEFSAFGKWHYEHFENVKFLEKDPNIDWINFFHDYNVLLVSYKDPLH